jgi:SAM-dependent methyltransferase
MSKIIDSQLSVYQGHFKEHGDTPEGTYNQNDALQHLRFERLIKQFAEADSVYTVHDIGCGICDLYQYFKDKGLSLKYSGTDIVPEMKDLALKKYPELDVKIRDIIEVDTSQEQYDFLVLAGTFNMPDDCPREYWTEFSNAMITKMFSMTRLGISFNFLTGFADFYHPDMYYRDPKEMMEFCVENLSRHVVVDHAYPLYEYTVTVFKEEYLRERYTDPRLQKYFKNL